MSPSFFTYQYPICNEQIGPSQIWEEIAHYIQLLFISAAAWWELIQFIFFIFYICLRLQNQDVF